MQFCRRNARIRWWLSPSGGSSGDDRDKKPKERVEATVKPEKFVDFGMQMTLGPVVAIRPNSPAARAGFRTAIV